MSSPDPAITRRGALAMGAGALAAGATAIIGGPGLSGTAQAAPEAQAGQADPGPAGRPAGDLLLPGLTVPDSLFGQIGAGEAAGVIFFGENIASATQIAALVRQLAPGTGAEPGRVPLLLMTDQEGGLVGA